MANFDYEKIDTSLVEKTSDEQLLFEIRNIELVGVNGWGLVAELCKRFEIRVLND